MAANAPTQTANAAANSAIAATPSRPRIHAAASAPHVSAKSATITTWTTHVDIASDCRLAKRVVREPRVDSANAVDHLRDAQVDDDARERERLATFETVLAPHELEHRVDRDRRRLVEILVESERRATPPASMRSASRARGRLAARA